MITRDEAEAFTEAHGQIMGGAWRLIEVAQRLGVPEALGLTTPEWVQQRLGGYIRYAQEERREAVKELTSPIEKGGKGLSTPEAAAVLGVGETTVKRDKRENGPNGLVGTRSQTQEVPTDGPSGPAIQESLVIDDRPRPTLTILSHEGEAFEVPKPGGPATFNETTGPGISWAKWSWNPVTGCLHGCVYCYAREIATSEHYRAGFPAGFAPVFRPERLEAPQQTSIPKQHRNEPQPCEPEGCPWRRVFVCSMADLYGRWVPKHWINQVHAAMLAAPQWEYLLLTKFPGRYVGLDLPPNAWVGTSVDEQKRVKLAEDAFRKIEGVKVKWLSLEPLREPLQFTDLSMFDWVVIGAQTETRQPDHTEPAFSPPFDWVARLYVQAKEAGCAVHLKPNLVKSPGMQWASEYPT